MPPPRSPAASATCVRCRSSTSADSPSWSGARLRALRCCSRSASMRRWPRGRWVPARPTRAWSPRRSRERWTRGGPRPFQGRPARAAGEIAVRGPTLFEGYLDDAQATSAALRDGWLRTRDLGALDERGRLAVYARRSDLILSGGENVYPGEVEAVLLSHPDVMEAAVLGRAHPAWGQVVVAILALRAGASFSPPALEEFCRARLAPFKVPRG